MAPPSRRRGASRNSKPRVKRRAPSRAPYARPAMIRPPSRQRSTRSSPASSATSSPRAQAARDPLRRPPPRRSCRRSPRRPGSAATATSRPESSAKPATRTLRVPRVAPDFTCTNCNCACPSTVDFAGHATDPNVHSRHRLDRYRAPRTDHHQRRRYRAPELRREPASVRRNAPSAARSRTPGKAPASSTTSGAPTIHGVPTNALHPAKCLGGTNRASRAPTTRLPRGAASGTCKFFFGSNLALAAGGVTTCVMNQFDSRSPARRTSRPAKPRRRRF